ncbi:MAG: TetR/AcrR family transcriptional regulator, partial [Actinomycetota bacterium]
YLREEQRLGRVARGVDPLAAATLLLGPCFQYVFLRHFMWEEVLPIPPDAFVKEIVKNLMNGIAPMKGAQR